MTAPQSSDRPGDGGVGVAHDQHGRVDAAGAELVDRGAGRQLEHGGEVGRPEAERVDHPHDRGAATRGGMPDVDPLAAQVGQGDDAGVRVARAR